MIIIDSGVSKASLYIKSLQWVTDTWKSANDVIQMNDADAGTIIVKGDLATKVKSLGMVITGESSSIITIRVKDGKAKIDFSDTQYTFDDGHLIKSSNGKMYTKWLVNVGLEQDGLIADY